ncbi:universal stress protein [Dactylosporangium aurantiacum]|uniref:Universal stress protein n=1 Tax=Dactylosporangium aurantiacum TaxID=35754 RepID=A0A9Q9ILQ0_9ACTN|nr:universal stress protein [Dactylosporangium aurantiacum]MDG6110125.1 universal stress protein [Dactylosporangium aurantiacum]UWZ57871.1 universal stress protein [Dactylosporangium aurantiacum]
MSTLRTEPTGQAPVAPPAIADRIAVGVEVSRSGLAALEWATAETAGTGAHLTVCHVQGHDDDDPAPDPSTLALTRPDLERYIRRSRQRVGAGQCSVELPPGDLVRALLALSERADLLVVGSRNKADPLHRSVASRLAAQAHCPVVIVRPVMGYEAAPFAGHVVVGVDGTPASAAAVRLAFAYARRHGRAVTAVHVDDRRPGDFWVDDRFLETHFTAEPPGLDLLARAVEPVAAGFPRIPVQRAVYGGDPVDGLRRAASGAALLVLGRHGHRRPAPLRLGSTSRAFASRAACVVAVVPEDTQPD